MRSYLSYKQSGELWGVVRNEGPWPEGYDILEATPTHPLAIANKEAHASDPEFGGFVALDCLCEEGLCDCGAETTLTHYVENGALVAKPALVVKINGAVQETSREDPLCAVPGSSLVLRVEAAVPDGTSATLWAREARLAPSTVTLNFMGGVATTTLTAPAQGMLGVIGHRRGKYLLPFELYVLGWA